MKRKYLIAAGGLVVLLAGGLGAGIASAAIPDSGGVIHACYQSPPPQHGANLQVIDTGNGGSCGGGMVALTWNQTGPQGPAGSTGPSTAGSSGLDTGVYTGGGSAFGYGNNLAVCPVDHPFALGGGVDAGGTSGVAVTQNEPGLFNRSTGAVILGSTGNGGAVNSWWTQTVNGGDNGGMAYVICSK